MVKSETRYVIDVVSLITFIINVISGFILWFALPTGPRAGRQGVFLGIARHNWVAIHDYSGLIFLIAVILHLIVNLNWLVRMTKKIFSPNG